MTDIHSHFVFQVDDGAVSLKDSLLLLEQAAKAGIKNLVATPHITETATMAGGKRIEENFLRVKESVKQNQIPVNVYLGSELYFNEFIFQWKDAAWYTSNNNRKYLLFEIPLFDLPVNVADFIFHCRLKGIKPILAHPERYHYLHDRRELLFAWHDQGCLMQMNAGSICGVFGKHVKRFTEKLLLANAYHFVASDAHDLVDRNYEIMPEAFQSVSDLIGADSANLLFKQNPNNSLEGMPIEHFELRRERKKNGSIKKVLEKLKFLSK